MKAYQCFLMILIQFVHPESEKHMDTRNQDPEEGFEKS